MIQELYKFLLHFFREQHFLGDYSKPLAAAFSLVALLLVAWLALVVSRFIILVVARRISRRTSTEWDDILLKKKVFHSIAHLIPAFIFYHSSNFASPGILFPEAEATAEQLHQLASDFYPGLGLVLLKWIKLYFIAVAVSIISTFLNAVNGIYQTTRYAHSRSIRGYVQLVKILLYFIAAILVISVILGKDPTVLIAGLGAMAAVLLLVFKDTILGFVASIQLSANDMVKIGDWIEMPGHRADGTVIDITLNTVKVQNWDRTITTIPTYALVSESFNNWKGMQESGGRRIKRAVYIDVNSIRFCNADMLARFGQFELIKDYVGAKEEEIRKYNSERNLAEEDVISGRRQTNVGIFRKYLENYLKNNQRIRQDMTFLVRQLQPGEKGLPIEIYVFSRETAWADYENLQSDIFDHVLAVIPEFGLRVFQAPSGSDIIAAAGNLNSLKAQVG
jgi:miniconductance mechanosensitive channel